MHRNQKTSVWYPVCEESYLQLPQGVVTLLLSCCLLCTERYQLVNTLCHRPETHRQPHSLFSSHVSSACTHRLASLTHAFSPPIQARHCRLLAAIG